MSKYAFLLSLLVSIKVYSQNLYFPPLIGNIWETKSASEIGWCSQFEADLYTLLEEENTKAFILLKDGKIVYEWYFDTFTSDSLWYWASAGKTLVSTLTGIAQEEGHLSINDASSIYLGNGWTQLTSNQENDILIKHQLSMTTGLDDAIGNSNCTDPSCLIYKANPGTRWAYHNAPYTLIDSVIEMASGQTFNSYFNQKIRNKIGMNGTFIRNGYNRIYVSNARSMARFGLLISNKGTWNNTTVLGDTAYFNAMLKSSQSLNKSYGYLWWLNGKESFMVPGSQLVLPGPLFPDAPMETVAALGANGQFINIVPSENLVWIRMGNSPSSTEVPYLLNNEIWKKLNQIQCLVSLPVEEALIAITIYPNPHSEQFSIHIPKLSDLEIYNIVGQKIKVLHNVSGKVEMTSEGWESGFYILRVKSGDKTEIKTIIKK